MSDAGAELQIRVATLDDLDALEEIEKACFDIDRLNRRSFKRWIQAEHGILLVAVLDANVVAYGLVWCHRGTRLARLYSLAVLSRLQGRGLARQLLEALEAEALQDGRLFMRLEVAKHNVKAIRLYESMGYRVFGEYSDYYDDHSDALRMQKTIQQSAMDELKRVTPWYQQTTEFTCGPAALMMAMASLDPNLHLDQSLELDLWREATTIYMTSGHGGCHPLGLALAAQRRGFEVCVHLNTREPLFVDGVRSEHKKSIMKAVHARFQEQAEACDAIRINYADFDHRQLVRWLQQDYAVITLISTYRLDGKKAAHWVTVVHADEHCLYVHDPDIDSPQQLAIDCQYKPIARDDFHKMSAFGSGRLRTALAIRLPQQAG